MASTVIGSAIEGWNLSEDTSINAETEVGHILDI